MIQLEGWFPTPIWYGTLDFDNTELKRECLILREKDKGVKLSNTTGWHSTPLLDPFSDEMGKVLKLLEQRCQEALDTLNAKKKLVMTHSWININHNNDTNNIHTHGGSILSGVYYIDIPEDDQSQIVFYRSHRQDLHFYDTIEANLPQVTAPHVSYTPGTDKFLIFPSWLEHDVSPSGSDQPRISLSFNTTLA